MSANCDRSVSCKKCSKPHATVLHKTKEDWNRERERQMTYKPIASTRRTATAANTPTATAQSEEKEAILPVACKSTKHSSSGIMTMILPVYVSAKGGKEALVYALLDSQSDASFIAEDTARELAPDFTEDTLTVATTNDECTRATRKYLDITIRGYYSQETTTMSPYEQGIIPCDRTQIPSSSEAAEHLLPGYPYRIAYWGRLSGGNLATRCSGGRPKAAICPENNVRMDIHCVVVKVPRQRYILRTQSQQACWR